MAKKSLSDNIQGLHSSLNSNKEELQTLSARMDGFEPANEVSGQAYARAKQEYARASAMQEELETASGFNTVNMALGGTSDALTVGIDVMNIFNQKTDELVKLQDKLQLALSATASAQRLMALASETSAMRITVLAQAKLFLTGMTNSLTAAFVSMGLSATGASIAVNVLYGALTLGISAAITGIVAGISAWVSKSNELEEKQRAQKMLLEEESRVRKQAAESVAPQLASYKKLQEEYKSLGGNMDKQQEFVKNNQAEFDKLGLSVTSVTEAENLFVRNEAAFVTSLKNRAIAAAATSQMEAEYKKIMGNLMEKEEFIKKGGNEQTKSDAAQITNEYMKKLLAQKKVVNSPENATAYLEVIKNGGQYRHSDLKRIDLNLKDEYDAYYQNQLKMLAEAEAAEMFDLSDANLEVEKVTARLAAVIVRANAATKKVLDDAGIKTKEDKKKEIPGKKEVNPEKKQQNPKPASEVTPPPAPVETNEAEITDLNKLEKEKANKQELLLDKYADYTQKRIDLEKKFNNDLAELRVAREEAQKAGDTEKVKRIDLATAVATKQKGSELMEMDYVQMKQSPEYVEAFRNLKATSKETLDSLLSQLQKIGRESDNAFSPESLKEYTAAVQSVMDELSRRNPFQELVNRKKELAEAKKDEDKAFDNLGQAKQQAALVHNNIAVETVSTNYNKETGKIEYVKSHMTEAQALANVKQKTDEYNKAKENTAQKSEEVQKAEKKTKEVMDELFNSINGLGKAIGGPAGEIISLIGDIGTFAMTAMSGVKTAADTSTAAVSTVEKASVILAVISAAIQIAMKIASLFKDTEGKEIYEDLKEQLEIINGIYDKIISKSKDKITFGTGFEAIQAATDAMDTLEKKLQNYRDLAAAGINYKDGSKKDAGWHSNKNVGVDNFTKMSQLVEKDINSVSDLVNLGVEDLYTIMSKMPGAWAAIDEHIRTNLESIIDYKDETIEVKEALSEAITGTSFEGFYNSFIDQLSNMETSAEDFTNNFEDQLRKSIMASIVADKFKTQIDSLYKNWVEYGNNDNVFTPDEVTALRQQQKDIADAMLAERENLSAVFGWESNNTTSQEATKKSFESMSQDTADQLDGRFSALQIAGEEIKAQSIQQTDVLGIVGAKADEILMVNSETRGIADEIRTIQVNSFLELQGIRENTGAIIKPIKEMAADIAIVKQNTSKL